MNRTAQESAAAAIDSYADRQRSDVDGNQRVFLDGREYRVFGYKDDPETGFHAAAYQSKETNEIIIAYRGTDPDFKHHTRTTAQDAYVDFMMVKDKVNLQEGAAWSFTREVLDKAHKHGIPNDQITVAGHSLGGTLAEIEASKFGLRGVTLNAYGAVDLGYGVSEGGTQVTNYVMAGDVVSAASRHYGQAIPLATEDDIASLTVRRERGSIGPGTYLDQPHRIEACAVPAAGSQGAAGRRRADLLRRLQADPREEELVLQGQATQGTRECGAGADQDGGIESTANGGDAKRHSFAECAGSPMAGGLIRRPGVRLPSCRHERFFRCLYPLVQAHREHGLAA